MDLSGWPTKAFNLFLATRALLHANVEQPEHIIGQPVSAAKNGQFSMVEIQRDLQ
jgi:hypothetical protein